ncbi:MAG: sulfotransferase domain-containing protein [Desertifilum sp. SIO1I2]|nr:sulfotransferase domain-containing protein [Desertifilum sp. SIO1I2]
MTHHQPDFIIIGGQKCGTTSLYNYLIQHPEIAAAATKEVHFFDLQFDKGVEWYQAQFPEHGITGEASPYYIFHPLVPQRIHQLYPNVKLIALLRDPVARTISHYFHEVRLGFEELSLESAIAAETTRLQGETEKMIADGSYYSFNHQHYTYRSRSLYLDQLKCWHQYFPSDQLLILESEEFYRNPALVVNQVFEFLQLPPYQLAQYNIYNMGDYSQVSETILHQLGDSFQLYNQQLAAYLGREFTWHNYDKSIGKNRLRGRLGQIRQVLAKYSPWTKLHRG